MRILTVCSSYRVFGAETVTLRLLEGLAKRGHDQLAVTSTWTDGEFSRRLKTLKIEDVTLPLGAFGKPTSSRAIIWTTNGLIRVPYLWWKWSQTLRRFQPDVILFASFKQAVWLYPWLKAYPSFLVEHAKLQLSRSILKMYRVLSRRLVSFVAVSEFIGSHLRGIGIPEKQVHVIRNGIFSGDEQQRILSEVGTKVRRSGPSPSLGIVGRVALDKGHRILFDAVRILKESGTNVIINIFGDGDPEVVAALKRYAFKLNIEDRCHWRGYRSNLSEIYLNFDVCVVPSLCDEAFGMVAAEAAAYCVPVIASKRGALPEIVVDDETGLLTKSGDPHDLAQKIEFLVTTPEHASSMGQKGQQRIFREFTQEQMVSGYEELFLGSVSAR
jgi:glycosyltransferase involved in cell wall biosynthesis